MAAIVAFIPLIEAAIAGGVTIITNAQNLKNKLAADPNATATPEELAKLGIDFDTATQAHNDLQAAASAAIAAAQGPTLPKA